MVNHKNVTFTVNKQTPIQEPPPEAYGIVINYGKPGAKRTSRGVYGVKLKLQNDPLSKAQQKEQRKRNAGELADGEEVASISKKFIMSHDNNPAALVNSSSPFPAQKPQLPGPTKFRKGKRLAKGVDLDCWFTILTFSDPAQLLEMRSKIPSCYRFLRDNPTLWKHSRSNSSYAKTLPDPPAELTEFQYAHLRHGHGCMSCGARSTRKTYWPFLRRWCKICLHLKVIKGPEALAMMRDSIGDDITFIAKCLPSGMFDSWGNFVGVGPANNHSLKTVYLLSDVQKLVAEFVKEQRDNVVSWHAEVRTWIAHKTKIMEDRREFAKKMEQWEDMQRTTRTYHHQEKKAARKVYFQEKAAELLPSITPAQMMLCPSFKRAILIPKEPNMTSWLQLRPKLEKEAADLLAIRAATDLQDMSHAYSNYSPMGPSTTGSSTPSHHDYNAPSSSYQYSTPHLPDPTVNPSSFHILNDYNSVLYPYSTTHMQQ
jgi:hypothetical protein